MWQTAAATLLCLPVLNAAILRPPAILDRLLSPPTPGEVLDAVDKAVYAADRERDALLARLKQTTAGSDALSALAKHDYALQPSAATIAVTGATDGLGREAAVFLAQQGFPLIICAR